MTSPFRMYFYDAAGNELVDHPLNGKTWTRSSGAVQLANGKFAMPGNGVKCLYRSSVHVADFASLDRVTGERKVTIADFPGMEKVGCKFWTPRAEHIEKFWLVASDHFTKG